MEQHNTCEWISKQSVHVSLPLCPPVAQKVVAMRKKQQLSIGPCKSLPNSPSHSSVPAASIPSVHINQVRSRPSHSVSVLLTDYVTLIKRNTVCKEASTVSTHSAYIIIPTSISAENTYKVHYYKDF